MSIKKFEQFLNENNIICEKTSSISILGNAEEYINEVKDMNKMGENIIKSILKEHGYINGNRLKFVDYPDSEEEYGKSFDFNNVKENIEKIGYQDGFFNLLNLFGDATYSEYVWLVGIWLGDDNKIHMDTWDDESADSGVYYDGCDISDFNSTLSDCVSNVINNGKYSIDSSCERENDLSVNVFWANVMNAIIDRFKQLNSGGKQLNILKTFKHQ
jgi:hypothetical protein